MLARSTITKRNCKESKEEAIRFYRVGRSNYSRTCGRAQRHYGQVNLKVDPTLWLQENKWELDQLEEMNAAAAHKLFLEEMSYICKTNKSDLVYITMQLFQTTINPKEYVDALMTFALVSEEMCEMVSLYLYLLCSYCVYGQQIKLRLFSFIKIVFSEILECQGEVDQNRSVYHPYHKPFLENKTMRANFCILVNLLFFRMRRDLIVTARYEWLAPVALVGMGLLMQFSFQEMCCDEEKYLGYIKTVVRLAQMNFHYILSLRDKLEDYDCSYRYILNLPRAFLSSGTVRDKEHRLWLLALQDIVTLGPVLPDYLYNYYKSNLGSDDWEKSVVQSNFHRILGPIHEVILSDYMDKFTITYDQYEDNAFVSVT